MADAFFPAFGRLPRSIVLSVLLVAAAQPAYANPRDSEDPAIANLQTRIEQMQRDLSDMRRVLDERKTVQSPPEAWRALGALGSVGLLAWVVVAVMREFARAKEAGYGARMQEIAFLVTVLPDAGNEQVAAEPIRERLKKLAKS